MTFPLELGLDTFDDVTTGANGELLFQPEVIRNVIAQAVLADRLGSASSGLESITARILPFLPRKSFWQPWPPLPIASALALP